MDNIIVDLDKVLDDFEAEEKDCSSQTPTAISKGKGKVNQAKDYVGYIDSSNTGSWNVVTDNSNLALVSSWAIKDQSEKLKNIYDIPYLPAEELDLSEADFSPSLPRNCRNTSSMEECSNTENGDCFTRQNDYTKLHDNSPRENQEKWKLPIQVADNDLRTYKLGEEQHTDDSQNSSFSSLTKHGCGLMENGSSILSQDQSVRLHNSIAENKDSSVLESVDSGCPPEPSSVSPTSPIAREVIQNGLSFSPPSDDSLEAAQIVNKLTYKKHLSDISNNQADISTDPTYTLPAGNLESYSSNKACNSENVSDDLACSQGTVIYEQIDLKSESVMGDQTGAVGFVNNDINVTEEELAEYLDEDSQFQFVQKTMSINEKTFPRVPAESTSVDAGEKTISRVSAESTSGEALCLPSEKSSLDPQACLPSETSFPGPEDQVPTVIDTSSDATDTKRSENILDQHIAPENVAMGTTDIIVKMRNNQTEHQGLEAGPGRVDSNIDSAIPFTNLDSQHVESALSEPLSPSPFPSSGLSDSEGEGCNTRQIELRMSDSQISQKNDFHEKHSDVSSFPDNLASDQIRPKTSTNSVSQAGVFSELEAVAEIRPKNKSNKKTRPNSLLGLSKVPLDVPLSSLQSAVTSDAASSGQAMEALDGNNKASTIKSAINDSRTPFSITDNDSSVISSEHCVEQLAAQSGESNTHSDTAGVPAVDPVLELPGELDEAPVMRRPVLANACLDSCMPARPHSWAPASNSTPPPLRNKRPTSLNLPSRSDFPVARDGSSAFSLHTQAVEELDENNESTEQGLATQGAEGAELSEVHAPFQNSVEGSEISEGAYGPPISDVLHPSELPPYPGTGTGTTLGQMAPQWVLDADAPNCMGCDARFTFTKRRHHCRACGKIFCSACCNMKSRLMFMESKEARVCHHCHQQITLAEIASRTGPAQRSPNPNNPSEYCSTVPPAQQVNSRSHLPTVMVPVGVLKRDGNPKKGEPKQVMFSDGIRPGGDLTELDGSSERIPVRRVGRPQRKVESQPHDLQHSPVVGRRGPDQSHSRNACLVPEVGLPPVIQPIVRSGTDMSGQATATGTAEDSTDMDRILGQIKDEEAEPVVFAVNTNLHVSVKYINLDCCVNRECWCYTTKGMCTVGQEEMVIVLETLQQENTIPRDIFLHFHNVYIEAGKGNTVSDMGHTFFSHPFLDSREHGGFLYVRPSFQCLQKLVLPEPPYIFGILLQKWETPWAKVFPIRLMLRLGAEYRYYPCPLISVRDRKPVLFEIGHTIMNLLADFRNFQYMLPQIRGITTHMGDKQTYINFPRNRYDDLMKVVSNSNEHVMAVGACFSTEADSHLVCIQNDDGNYQTQAINIQNKTRKVTGASFVVFNGALKTSSGLKAKSSIVEDGLMVQITPDSMVALKHAMKDMKEYSIQCGSIAAAKPEEVITVRWVEEDRNVNIGVKSPIDNMSMDGIESIYIHNSTDYIGENGLIRWTEVFFIRNEDSGSPKWEPVDLSRLAETLSSACCIALTPHLDALKEAWLTKLGLRVTVEAERVGYDIGAKGSKLPDLFMNDMDNELIPVIHSAASQNHDGPIILELIFHVLE